MNKFKSILWLVSDISLIEHVRNIISSRLLHFQYLPQIFFNSLSATCNNVKSVDSRGLSYWLLCSYWLSAYKLYINFLSFVWTMFHICFLGILSTDFSRLLLYLLPAFCCCCFLSRFLHSYVKAFCSDKLNNSFITFGILLLNSGFRLAVIILISDVISKPVNLWKTYLEQDFQSTSEIMIIIRWTLIYIEI